MSMLKRSLAAIMALLMMVCCLVVSAETINSTVTVTGNESSPATVGTEETVDIILSVSNFSNVAGINLTVTLPDVATFATLEATDSAWTAVPGENYLVSGKKIRITDVFNIGKNPAPAKFAVKISVRVNGSMGEYPITVSGMLTDKNEADIKTVFKNGKIIMNKTSGTETNLTESVDGIDFGVDGEKYFIPYGSAYYISEGTEQYLTKNKSGKFIIPSGVTNVNYAYYRLPKGVISTFGASAKTDETSPAVQFGTYVTDTADKTFGTMYIVGDWEAFSEYYMTKKGYSSVEQLLRALYNTYDSKVSGEYTHIIVRYGSESIKVFKKAQNKYMWKGENGELQYALRVIGVEADTQLSAVGYAINGENYELSTEISTASYNSLVE